MMSKLEAPLRMASADSLAEFVERHPDCSCSPVPAAAPTRAFLITATPPASGSVALRSCSRRSSRTNARASVTGRGVLSASAACGLRAPTTRTLAREPRATRADRSTRYAERRWAASGGRQSKRDRSARPHRYGALPGCERRSSREQLQLELERRNPDFASLDAMEAPDGDADLEDAAFGTFDVPAVIRVVAC